VESGNDYVIQVKGNTRKLLKIVKDTINYSQPDEVAYTKEKSRDRIENRECHVYEVPKKIEGYQSCSTIVYVKSYGKRGRKPYKEDHYYITNKKTLDADYYLKGVRGHWAIENSCHWVKDVILNEDNSRVKGLDLSENLSTIRHMIMNVYRLNNHKSIKIAIEKYSNRLKESLLLINQLHI